MVVAIFPAVGYCFNSSITSYENTITIIGSESDYHGMTVDQGSKDKGFSLSDKGTDSSGRDYCELTHNNGSFSDGKTGSSATINVNENIGFWIEVIYGKNAEFTLTLYKNGNVYGNYNHNVKGNNNGGNIFLEKPSTAESTTLSVITKLDSTNSIKDNNEEITIVVTGSNPSGQAPIRIFFFFESKSDRT